MRMDIEYSPGARGQRNGAAARDCDGLRLGEGGMSGKRLCSMSHPAHPGGEHARRFPWERTMGVLWHHSSVNLVEPRPSHWPRRIFPGGCRRLTLRLASGLGRRNRRGRKNGWLLAVQFRINHCGVIQAFGFNDLAGADE
jgi:hypothetical protein